MSNDGDYLKRHEYLTFDKSITPKLTIIVRESIFEYASTDGNTSSVQFKPTTSEYKILISLVGSRDPINTSQLTNFLNEPRKDAEDADPKQRVRDKIKSINKKLGKDLIKRKADGYVIDCEIVRE